MLATVALHEDYRVCWTAAGQTHHRPRRWPAPTACLFSLRSSRCSSGAVGCWDAEFGGGTSGDISVMLMHASAQGCARGSRSNTCMYHMHVATAVAQVCRQDSSWCCGYRLQAWGVCPGPLELARVDGPLILVPAPRSSAASIWARRSSIAAVSGFLVCACVFVLDGDGGGGACVRECRISRPPLLDLKGPGVYLHECAPFCMAIDRKFLR